MSQSEHPLGQQTETQRQAARKGRGEVEVWLWEQMGTVTEVGSR